MTTTSKATPTPNVRLRAKPTIVHNVRFGPVGSSLSLLVTTLVAIWAATVARSASVSASGSFG